MEIITEEEYDKLPMQSQRKYAYCVNCNLYYLIRKYSPHYCEYSKALINKTLC